jgi:hypothetical protein
MISGDNPLFRGLAGPNWRFVELPTGHWLMFSRPEDLADDLDGEDFRVGERGAGSRLRRLPRSLSRSSMRQKTAAMKVLYSVRQKH